MRRTGVLVWGCCALLIACDGGDDEPPSDAGRSGGGSAGGDGGGAGSAGTRAGSGGSKAGSGGDDAGSGGSDAGSGGTDAGTGTGGSGGTTEAGAGGNTSVGDVDLTLGGFNQDLPEPPTDCSAESSSVGCVSLSGTYDDEPFAATCHDDNTLGAGEMFGGFHFVRCQLDLLGGSFAVALLIGQELLEPRPIAYEWAEPSDRMYVYYAHDARELASHRNDAFALGDTHEEELAVAGAASLREGPVDGQVSVWLEGVFAGTLSPVAGCTPDAMGFGCDEIRFRARYAAYTELDVQP